MAKRYNRTFGVLYHATTPENAESIRKSGFKVGSAQNAGQGVYLTQSEDEAKRFGESVIPVALQKDTLIHPEPYDDPSVSHLVGHGTGPEEWSEISGVLSSKGWHGHVDYQGGGDKDHVVVYHPERLKLL